jgi:hypothetical protein
LQGVVIVAGAFIGEIEARADDGDAVDDARGKGVFAKQGAECVFEGVVREKRGIDGEAAVLIEGAAGEEELAGIGVLSGCVEGGLVGALFLGEAEEVGLELGKGDVVEREESGGEEEAIVLAGVG